MKKILMIIIIVFCVLCLNGCTIENENTTGIKKGFTVPITGLFSAYCAVTSEKTQFEINDFTINFYYGIAERFQEYLKNDIDLRNLSEDSEYVSILWIVTTEKVDYYVKSYNNYEDIINKENIFLIKEVLKEQLLTDEYLITLNGNSRMIYSKYEKIQIPKKIFEFYNGNNENSHYLYFIPLIVQKTKTEKIYYILEGCETILHYQVAGDYILVS